MILILASSICHPATKTRSLSLTNFFIKKFGFTFAFYEFVQNNSKILPIASIWEHLLLLRILITIQYYIRQRWIHGCYDLWRMQRVYPAFYTFFFFFAIAASFKSFCLQDRTKSWFSVVVTLALTIIRFLQNN